MVEIWKGDADAASAVLRNVTQAGYDALYTCKQWYFDYQPCAALRGRHLSTRVEETRSSRAGATDNRINDESEWSAVYNAEPLPGAAQAGDDQLMGGEACMWAAAS